VNWSLHADEGTYGPREYRRVSSLQEMISIQAFGGTVELVRHPSFVSSWHFGLARLPSDGWNGFYRFRRGDRYTFGCGPILGLVNTPQNSIHSRFAFVEPFSRPDSMNSPAHPAQDLLAQQISVSSCSRAVIAKLAPSHSIPRTYLVASRRSLTAKSIRY
jgi:hypothetical protein